MSSTRSCGSSSSSSTSNSNSTNHMPARRANSSRRTSESSSTQQLGTTTSTTSSSSTARQQHVADKSAVKRKKRRKDEDEERVPVVLLTRLEDKRKSNECKVKRVTEVKVVVERACDIESIRAPALVAGKKSTRHPVHRGSENLANGDAKATEPIRLEVELKKVVAVVVEDAVKAPPKKSIESAKSSESGSSKVKSDRKPADRSTERNVHNVNNDDNNRKTIDPKITERRLLVKLDRSEVQNYLAAQKRVQRLRAEEEVVDKSETDKYHSKSENQDDDVACKPSTEIKTCAITSDNGGIQNDSVEKTSVDDATNRLKEVQKTDATNKVKKVQKPDVTNKVEESPVDDVTDRLKEVQKTDTTKKVKKVRKPDITNKVEKIPVDGVTDRFKEVQKTDTTDKVKRVQKPNVINKVENTSVDDVTDRLKEVQKTDATDKVKEVQKPDVVTNKVKEVQKIDVADKVKEVQKADVEKPLVECTVKRRGRPRKDKNLEEPAKSVVKNQRLSSSREKRKAKSQDDARKSNKANSDKDLEDDTKIHKDSSVQVNKNQTERLDESPKDTFCESTKSSLSSESFKESAVVNSEQVSSETSKTDKVSYKIIESNSGSDNDSSVVAAVEPVPLPMEVDEIPHEHTVVDDSKAESESAQQICDIHSKNVDENAETIPKETETVDKSTEGVLSEPSTENLMEGENSESPLENLVRSDITECPAKSSEENETCQSTAKNLQASETSENLVNGEIESPTDSFVSCENAESTNEESMNGENNEMIETLEDTESIASTCTLIEETPEELSKELDDVQEELPEDLEKQTEEPAEEDAHKEPESIKELPEKEDDTASETSLKTDKLDESFSSDDKANETNEHESTFENNLKSVENLVIDSILNGEIVSPKMIVPSATSRVEQSFVFEGGVEDFVADIVASKAVSLESSTPVEGAPSLVENLEPAPVVEAAPIVETVAPSVPIEEPALVEHAETLPSVEQQEPAAEEETSESPPVIEETTIEEISEPAAPAEEPPVDEEFAKHRRKDATSELENNCEENTDCREALEEACTDVNAEREEDQQPPPPSAFGVENNSDVNDLQVPSSELVSSDCYPEPAAVGSDNYFENVSDADSEICLADRLNQLSDLKIPSLEETLPSEKLSDVEESSPSDHTKRQRILMKITKTDANEHVTHLVESKEEEETPLPINNDQFAADQVTEGEIKIIMRKESSSNNHVIKEIKIIPRTPEGNNSARIPGYSPTSSDLSSGNSSCRVPSCSPAKPDSGSYRMPGWSPASTETGQTSTTATTKKKQGRPKKYPIFTDAELIAKTTAIVNNVDVHVASKLADKPMFEPVESIRINEDDEVERDDDDEHQTVITEQTCLSGSQLLEAMPAQPEIAAELTRKIEEDQSATKKKKTGRPRKYPLPDEDVGTKSENVRVARIEFNVVDSIEEFVEPVEQIPPRPVSPLKKRGRPRKYPLESAETSAVEESDSIVESVLIHEVPSDKKARNANSSMTENAGMIRRKPFKTLKDLLNKSPDIQPADDADSQTEDEAPVVEPYVERRGGKPWKHLKDLKRAADQENSTTENEVASDASPVKPYVERRGRKPWKHLKELNKLSESRVAENSTTENEAASDASPVKAYVERRGRKPWKHLKDASAMVENEVADDADSQTEDEAPVAAPYVERRGRKPWKHLKNLDKSKNQVTEDGDSQTEDETPATAPYVERRGRKPWKHLKNLDKSSEIGVTEDADSQTEDEAPVVAPYVERRGRKPWKHLKNLDETSKNHIAEDADSQTEDEAPTAAPYVERRGRKPWKHLKNLDKSLESQIAQQNMSTTENDAVSDALPVKIERRGRKPKHLKNLDKSADNQVAEDADSQTEDEAPVAAPYVERRGRKPWKHLKNLDKSSYNQLAEDANSQTEDEAPVGAPYVERRGRKPWKHLKNLDKSKNQVTEDGDSQTEGETPATTPYVERKGRKPWKHLKNLDKSQNQVTEDGDSQTEDETPVTVPCVERRGRKPWKHLKHATESSENQVAEQENSTAENNAFPAKGERRGRKPWKHLKDANKSTETQDAEETNSQTEDETIQVNLETEQPVKKRRRRKSQKLAELSATEGATFMTEDESADDTPLIEKENPDVLSTEKTSFVTENESADGSVEAKPYVERRGRKPKHLKDPNKYTENQVDEGADSQTEDEAPDAASHVERRGRKPSKHLKNLDNSSESQATEQDMSATETDAVSDASLIKVERGGRLRKYKNEILPNGKRKRGRPRLYPPVSENQAADDTSVKTLQDVQNAGEASSIIEEEPVKDDGAIEPVVREKEAASELMQDDETTISENIVTEEPASNNENKIGSDTPLTKVIVKKKRGRKPLKDSEDTTVTSVAEETNSMTEDESADEDAIIGEQAVVADKPAVVPSPEKKKRGRRPKNQLEAQVSLPENQTTDEASSMTDVPTVEPIVKKRGRPRKYSQDEAIPEIPVVAQDASPVTEDETVSSTEDIPTSNNFVEKLVKSVSPIKIVRNQVLEQPSSQTEDETVSSTEDIPTVEQQQPQPIVKKVKFAALPHTSDSSSTPSGSSVEDSTSTMEPPVAVKKRGRLPKIARQADSTNESVDNTTENETVSSTEDIPIGEQHVMKKKQGRPKKNLLLPSFEPEAMNNSLAASSVEDLSTFELAAPKKRGRKPHPRPLDGDENSSMAASSMEDLSAVVPPLVVKKKRGRKPRALMQNDNTCSDSIAASSMEDLSRLVPPSVLVKKRGRPPKIPRIPIAGYVSADSMEEFSPMQKQLETFAVSFGHSIFDTNQQVAYDRSLSPVKKRGRPPKYPRENIEAPKRVSIAENPGIVSTPTIEQQPPVLEKRKGRLPRRLSQDENILPSILRSDKLMGRRASHDSGIIPAFSLSDGGETMPSLGKRQGRPPRKFSPDEEHSFSALPNHVQMENESPKKLGRPPIIRKDDGLPMSQSLISDSDETSSGVPKRRGRRPKKFALEDGFTSSRETSPTKRRGRPPKYLQDLSLPLPQPETKEPQQDVSLPLVAPCVLSSIDDVKKAPTISTTNLLRQQRKPRMAQPQPPVAPAVIVQPVQQPNEPPPPPPSPVKKRGRPKLLPTFDIGAKLQPDELPHGLTIEQLRRRRHSQDDSMFTNVVVPAMLAARPKEFEDAQPRKRRGRPPKVRELPQPFVLQPVKQVAKVPALVAPIASMEDSPKLKERLNRPRKPSPERIVAPVQETTTKLTAADFLRTWTDRDDSPAPQATQQPTKKPGTRQRRFSQDFTLDESSRPSSRNRLRRYSQGDALDDTSNDELRFNARKRLRSSGSDGSIVQDEKRPRVERDLCDQHSITKELVVQLTKIDKGEESPTAPCQLPQQSPMSSDLVRMNLRRKLEGNNSGSEPPPLVPIEPNRLQPPTHSDAKLLMLMQPSEDKTMLHTTATPSMQPPTQQFCIIFIPDALTSSESSLSKDSQPTATIVNFQPVPDSELANKSVIYTPTTPTKIFVNSSVEEQQRHRSFLCTTCTQALDLVGRLEANMGMTEEDKCAIKCPFCSNDFQSVFYLEYHLRQEHLKCENERQCRHPGFNTLRIPSHDAAASESEIYITFALKCRSCYELFDGVHSLNEHVMAKHANLIRLHKPAPLASGMICYPPPPPPSSTSSPFKNGARPELLHCPSDCICRVGIRSTDSPMQRAQMLKRCPNFMRRLEKIEAAAYEVYTCTLCKSTFLMKDEVVEHLMKMHEVACKFPCTKCLASFRSVQLQEAHHCSETTIRDLDKLLNIVIMPTDKAHDGSKFEDSSNDELGPIKTTPPPAIPSASTPLNGVKRKNGVVIQRLTRFLAMQPPKKPRLEPSAPGTPVTSKKRQKTPCPKCQKKFAYRKSLNDHIIFEHIIPCKADEASKNMAVELLRLVNNGATDQSKIEELATALGKYTDDEGTSLKKLTLMDEQENWNEAQHDGERDVVQCVKCKVGFRVPNTANLTRRNNHQRTQSPIPQLCDRCDPTRRRRNNAVNNGHKFNSAKPSVNGDQIRYTYECIQCGESFPTTIELNSHKSREHSTRPSDSALKCDSCPKIFYSSRMLEKHKKLQHDASASHDDNNSSRVEDYDDSMNCSLNSQSGAMDTSKDSEAALNDTANSSSTSRRDSSDGNNKDEEETCKCPRCDFSAEKVSLKNHLKREHGIMAFICQFCGKLLVEISEVRHMLDYHIKSSRKNGGVAATLGCAGDEVSELLRTLGKKRLQSLMIYHDFEGKCNNAIMRCPICPEQFATRESCRHHYQWMHDCTCILCDASFGGGNLAGQHKVAVHNSIASYVWAIQRLVSAIVHGLRLDRAHPSNVLYQEVSMRLDALEQQEIIESEMLAAARASNKTCEENVVVVPEPFLEPVVLSEDQLPGSGNMIEVVIGNDMVVEDAEDNLLENFYLSPNYESSCEQPRILDAGAPIPELEEEEEVVTTIAPIVNTCATIAIPTTPSITTSNGGILIPTTPVTAETYATSAVFKLRQDNGQEEVVLAITDEDLVTYRDDIGSLAEKLSATCDSLSLEEIITMLRSYFENVGTPQTEEVQVEQFAIEPRTQ